MPRYRSIPLPAGRVLGLKDGCARTLRKRGSWRAQHPLQHASVASLTFASLAALILLVSSFQWTIDQLGDKKAFLGTGGTPGNTSQELPYLVNASSFPAPDSLSVPGSNLSLPQLAVTSYGSTLPQLGSTTSLASKLSSGPAVTSAMGVALGSIPMYELGYSVTSYGGQHSLEYRTATVNATYAYNLMTKSGCTPQCKRNLSLSWSSQVNVANFGSSSIQQDGIATLGSVVALAASVGGNTHVYYSPNYGTNGSWIELTSKGLVAGANPKLAVTGCGIFVATTTSSNTVATTIPVSGPSCIIQPNPGTSSSSTSAANQCPGCGTHQPLTSGPTVTRVSPSWGYAGTPVSISGTGFTVGGLAQVSFGSLKCAVVSIETPTLLVAVAPPGISGGLIHVSVTIGGSQSPPNPPFDEFNYSSIGTAPTVSFLTPTSGTAGSTITVYGSGFAAGHTSVLFDLKPSSSVSVISTGKLTATVPNGLSAAVVDVQVLVGSEISPVIYPQDVFTASGVSPTPSVVAVYSDVAPVWSMVTILGTGFAPQIGEGTAITATLCGASTANVFALSTTELEAIIPTGATVGNSIDTIVSTLYGPSPTNPPFDQLKCQTPGWPVVSGLSMSRGPVSSTVTVYGSNFLPNATVNFGTYSSALVRVPGSGILTAVAPNGVGTVNVTVTVAGHTSNLSIADRFTYTGGPASYNLPLSLSESPFLLTTSNASIEEAMLVSLPSNDSIEWLTSTSNFASYNTHWIGFYNTSYGSPAFVSIGDTNLQVHAGTPGLVTGAVQGQYIFAAFTTRAQATTELATVVSSDGGAHWRSGSIATAARGALDTPIASPSPAGYIFLGWRDNSQGSWEVDQAVFAVTGRILIPPIQVPGSGGANGSAAISATVSVDHFERPLYLWSTNSSGTTVLRYTGGLLTPSQIVSISQRALANSLPSDYFDFGSQAVYNFRSALSSGLSTTLSDLGNRQWSSAISETLGTLYPDMSPLHPGLAGLGSRSPSCTATLGTGLNYFTNGSGPYDAGTFMTIYIGWLIQAEGCGTLNRPAWPGTPANGGLVVASGNAQVVPFGTSASVAFGNDSLKITPIAVNPDLVLLNASASFPGVLAAGKPGSGKCPQSGCTLNYAPQQYQATVVVGSSWYTYWSSWGVPDVYVTNLTPQTSGFWYEMVTVYYSEEVQPLGAGSIAYDTPPTLGPATLSLYLYGNYTTWLGYDRLPPRAVITSDSNGDGKQAMAVNWTASMLSQVQVMSVSGPNNYHQSFTNPSSAVSEWFNFTSLTPSSQSYLISYSINSSAGSNSIPSGDGLNSGQSSGSSAPLTSSTSCSFTDQTNPIHIWFESDNVTNVSATDVTLTWYATQTGQGSVQYNDTGGAVFSTVAQVYNQSHSGNFTYKYVAEVHGLDPWGLYSAAVNVASTGRGGSGCVVYLATGFLSFLTTGVVPLSEQDFPYDSVTQQGGGAGIQWSVPWSFLQIAGFSNGTFSYWPINQSRSTELTVSFSYLTVVGYSQGSSGIQAVEYGLNITANLTGNWTYQTALQLNFTFRGSPYGAVGSSFSFQYQKDSSGDGLTDWEKIRGWNVTVEGPSGGYTTNSLGALPGTYATNGLSSDFIEKEFGLNAATIDTANSRMLDTWNLTFNLGSIGSPGQPALPSNGFRYWYENSTYAFNKACPDPNVSTCSFTPLDQNASALSDNSPWAAQVLWSGQGPSSALAYLQSLEMSDNVPWLRAVTGSYDGFRTLTVWGKLSWGANPLATSTPLDGVADGLRVNPLYDEELQIAFGNYPGGTGSGGFAVNPNGTSGGCGNLPNGAGVALRFYVPGTTAGFSGDNYSAQMNLACPSATSTTYRTTIPVSQSSQAEKVSIEMWANTSTNNLPKPQDLPINGCHWSYNISIGMMNATSLSNGVTGAVDLWGNPSGSCSGGHGVVTESVFGFSEVPAGLKAPTWIWLPRTNGTLSSLPWGLKRYTGEQSFDLVTVNNVASIAITSDGIPLPWGGISRPITLNPGLNQFLVPRGQLMYSAFGQAVLAGHTVQNSTLADGPLLLGNQSGTIVNSGGPADLAQIECYWQNRAVGSAPSLCGGGFTGTQSNTTLAVSVVSAPACTTKNCGGVPGGAGLENASLSGAAIQNVIPVNLTATNGRQQLDTLLAALLVNITASGVNGTFQAITEQLPSMGLGSAVTAGLANASVANDGDFAAPVSHALPPPQPSSWFVAAWNAASGVFYNVATGNWGGVVSDLTAFAIDYTMFLAAGMISFGMGLVARTVQGLQTAEAVIYQGLASAIRFMVSLAQEAINAAVQPILNGLKSRSASLLQSIVDWENGHHSKAVSEAANGIAPIAIAAAALAVVITVVSLTLEPEEEILGPVSTVLSPLILTAFGLGFPGSSGTIGTSFTSWPSVSAFLSWVASGVNSFVPGQCAQTQQDVNLIAALLFGVSFVFGMVAVIIADFNAVQAGEHSNLGADLGLLVATLVVFMMSTLLGWVASVSTGSAFIAASAFAVFADFIAVIMSAYATVGAGGGVFAAGLVMTVLSAIFFWYQVGALTHGPPSC